MASWSMLLLRPAREFVLMSFSWMAACWRALRSTGANAMLTSAFDVGRLRKYPDLQGK
jgi:hypothetical protein